MGLVLYFSSQKFQSTLPQRERRWEFKECNIATYISIHAPAKGATSSRYPFSWSYSSFQSTLPRRERPCFRKFLFFFPYFNPRSHKGSDGGSRMGKIGNWDFNPRSHKGSDNRERDVLHLFLCISIHAPAKGATIDTSVRIAVSDYFNPLSHEGSD